MAMHSPKLSVFKRDKFKKRVLSIRSGEVKRLIGHSHQRRECPPRKCRRMGKPFMAASGTAS
jgi:hypothetical protein